MAFGILLSGFNHVHYGDTLGFIFEFIPQMVFLVATFGYMDFMIIYKLCTDWNHASSEAPNLITTLMDMFLKMGGVKEGFELFSGQKGIQQILLVLTVLSSEHQRSCHILS